MIVLKKDMPLKIQLQNDIQELENYKNTYMQKIYEYKEGTNYINSLLKEQECTQMTDTLSKNSEEKIKIYNTQVLKIERNLEVLNDMLENIDNLNKDELIKNIKKYNKKYTEIKRNISINSINFEPNMVENFQQNIQEKHIENKETKEEVVSNDMKNVLTNKETMGDMNNNLSHIENSDNNNEIQNNDTLLISEILNAVVLPYTAEEVLEILKNESETYKTAEEVIKDKFTRPLSDYRVQFWSRYNETIKLLTVRQDYKLGESIPLALEIMRKRFLHPAIISACRSLDELDVYLDCLDKNEVDDFKIFKIKYELHPILVKNNGKDKKNGFFKFFSMKPKSKEI
ncbi:MAG: hypothetical protein IJ777_01165 [Clostridia bacterium]|nr:hypothetical protein [Clostridia bacterium]